MITNVGDYEIANVHSAKEHPGGWVPLSVAPGGQVFFFRPVDPPPEKEARDTDNCLPRSPIVLHAAAKVMLEYADHLEHTHDLPDIAASYRRQAYRVTPDREQRPTPLGEIVSHQDAVDAAVALRDLAAMAAAKAAGPDIQHIVKRYRNLAARIDPDTEE